MTEREPMTPFEARLARRFEVYANVPTHRTDANVAAALEWAGRRRNRRFGLDRPTESMAQWMAIAALLIALAATAVLVAGMLPHPDAPRLGRLVYADSKGGLYLADASGQNSRKIEDGRFERPRWSPDGQFIAVTRDPQSLQVLRSDGSIVLDLPAATTVGDYEWAPGQTGLFAGAVDGTLTVWDFHVGTKTTVVGSERGAVDWAWTTDSTVIWISEMSARPQPSYTFQAARIEQRGASLAVIAHPALQFEMPAPPAHRAFGRIRPSPDGSRLASAARLYNFLATQLVLLPPAGGAVQVFEPHMFRTASVAWTADSRSVIGEAFNERADVQLLVMPVDGSAPRPLFDQALFESWLLLDDGPVDLSTQPVLIGYVPTNDGDIGNVPVMDLYLLDPGAKTPRSLSYSVLGADIHWSEATP